MTTEVNYEARYKILAQLLASAATRIDFNGEGNYTAVTTRVFLDGNLTHDFSETSPHKIFILNLAEKLDKMIFHAPVIEG